MKNKFSLIIILFSLAGFLKAGNYSFKTSVQFTYGNNLCGIVQSIPVFVGLEVEKNLSKNIYTKFSYDLFPGFEHLFGLTLGVDFKIFWNILLYGEGELLFPIKRFHVFIEPYKLISLGLRHEISKRFDIGVKFSQAWSNSKRNDVYVVFRLIL